MFCLKTEPGRVLIHAVVVRQGPDEISGHMHIVWDGSPMFRGHVIRDGLKWYVER